MIVVADTSVFLNLGRIGQAELLRQLYSKVAAPPVVRDEFVSVVTRFPRFQGLTFPDWVVVQAPLTTLATIAPWARLDPGESAALALASELPADLVLVDEARGREVARRLGLRVAGLLAVLLDARQRRLVPAVRPLLDGLATDAGFWLAPAVRERVLRLAGELT